MTDKETFPSQETIRVKLPCTPPASSWEIFPLFRALNTHIYLLLSSCLIQLNKSILQI